MRSRDMTFFAHYGHQHTKQLKIEVDEWSIIATNNRDNG